MTRDIYVTKLYESYQRKKPGKVSNLIPLLGIWLNIDWIG